LLSTPEKRILPAPSFCTPELPVPLRGISMSSSMAPARRGERTVEREAAVLHRVQQAAGHRQALHREAGDAARVHLASVDDHFVHLLGVVQFELAVGQNGDIRGVDDLSARRDVDLRRGRRANAIADRQIAAQRGRGRIEHVYLQNPVLDDGRSGVGAGAASNQRAGAPLRQRTRATHFVDLVRPQVVARGERHVDRAVQADGRADLVCDVPEVAVRRELRGQAFVVERQRTRSVDPDGFVADEKELSHRDAAVGKLDREVDGIVRAEERAITGLDRVSDAGVAAVARPGPVRGVVPESAAVLRPEKNPRLGAGWRQQRHHPGDDRGQQHERADASASASRA
jgi:hypothetical protein